MNILIKTTLILILLSVFSSANSIEKLSKQLLLKEWNSKYILIQTSNKTKAVCLKMEGQSLKIIENTKNSICDNSTVKSTRIKKNGALCLKKNSNKCRKVRKTDIDTNRFYFGKKMRSILVFNYKKNKVILTLKESIDLSLKEIYSQIIEGDKSKLFKIESLAKDFNHTQSQLLLSGLSLTSKKYNEAFNWSLMAANNENTEAQNNVGVFLLQGLGVEKDPSKALGYFEKSANNGHVSAQGTLGGLYFHGIGTEIDYKLALKWFNESANQGHSESQLNLGIMYSKGKGVYKNIDTAIQWLKKSAKQENAVAQFTLGLLYQKNNNFDQAIHWYAKSSIQGHVDASYNLGLLYQTELKDFKMAENWYLKAIEHNDFASMVNLGEMYAIGKGIKKDLKKAKRLIKESYENSNDNTIKREAEKIWNKFELGRH